MTDLPRFRAGQRLTADELNAIVAQLIRRIVPGPGIDVRYGAGQVVIGLNSQPPIPPTHPSVLGEITAEDSGGGGVYEWAKVSGEGPESDWAEELNWTEGLTVGTRIQLHKIAGQWLFSSSAAGSTIAKITSETGDGEYEWELEMGSGPESGVAFEMNGSVGILPDTVVVLHKVDGEYWFFFPIEECEEG